MQNGGYNQIVLIGDVTEMGKPHFGRDNCAIFRMKTDRYWRDKTTQLERKATTSHNVLGFNELSDVIMEHIRVGQLVFVTGMMQYYKDFPEVVADFIKIIREA
jgi:single-stranded DNA-binding protein